MQHISPSRILLPEGSTVGTPLPLLVLFCCSAATCLCEGGGNWPSFYLSYPPYHTYTGVLFHSSQHGGKGKAPH
ncbi:hypothetical protein B9Z19DRAFT_1073944 [Tuber borchii]|uniref:Secreted protein n=1 Tax=Tuber borchii TaxID=42251 RepID=A0A2T7A5C9_TUBBO|nr:hypothetical protein B9Z19DRAFT_1073944 [Tuber borchii]